MSGSENFHSVVIGGGQSGLAAAYYLKKIGSEFVVLDASARTGDSWRRRWDSLRLFTPSKFNALPGKPFLRSDFYFPTKDEVAQYLEDYVGEYNLPVRRNVTVDALEKTNGSYRISAGGKEYRAEHVIVATGAYQRPVVPSCASQLHSSVVQLHSDEYRNPSQLPKGTILVVGAGNSGAEISIELASTGRSVLLAGKDVGKIPSESFSHILGGTPYWLFLSRILSVNTPIGRKVQERELRRGTPLVRLNSREVMNSGVTRCPRLRAIRDGLPMLENGQVLNVDGVVWATGYHPDFRWIKIPVFGDHGYPLHNHGIVPKARGLYFVGLHFQTALSSSLLGGVGNDARIVVEHIDRTSNNHFRNDA